MLVMIIVSMMCIKSTEMLVKIKKVMNMDKNTIVLPVCNNAFYFHCSIFLNS